MANSPNNTGGTPGKSRPQQPIAGPENPGPPASMSKAMAKKQVPMGHGVALKTKGTSAPGAQ